MWQTQTLTHITHRYLEDFLCVIEHLHPYGDLLPWRLSGRTQAWLQGGHPKAFRGAQPLSSCRRPVCWFDHDDRRYSTGLSGCRDLCLRLEERGKEQHFSFFLKIYILFFLVL